MVNSYLLKKKIAAAFRAIWLATAKSAKAFYRLAFAKRTILFVTNQKIRSVTLGPLTQAAVFVFIAWVGNLFIQSLNYNKIIDEKAQEISHLKSMNGYFEREFGNVNDKLKKVNEYLMSVTGGVHEVKAEEEDMVKPVRVNEEGFSKQDKHTLRNLNEVNGKLAEIQSLAKARMKKIERAIAVTGLNVKKTSLIAADKYAEELMQHYAKNKAQGGPLKDNTSLDSALALSSDSYDIESHLKKLKFTSELDYLILLEGLAKSMPLARPMKNYYISSGFGVRIDPITGGHASHRGLDFVGPQNEKIISPSGGKVILAGRYSDYGNAIVIDHGFGITTRYGHLSKVKVAPGQIVKAGQVIAIQGNTGRSTGQHLHYEVRYRNAPLNPRKFLEAGEILFNDEKSVKYVNS